MWHLSRESAGVALAFGYAMGQGRAALLIQSTGLGNVITELMTLPVLYGLPLPLLVSWRGHYRENIEAQTILGERIVPMLRGLEIPVTAIETPDDLGQFDAGLLRALKSPGCRSFCYLRGCGKVSKSREHPKWAIRAWLLSALWRKVRGCPRVDALSGDRVILETLTEDQVLVAQIGFPAREACAIRDRERNLYLLGALGSATLVGVGLAEARPDLRIVVLDGDGSFILNPNQMLELSRHCPKNLSVVLLDNGSWGSTGSQPTLTGPA